MDTESIIVGTIMIVLGGLYAFWPSIPIRFQVWTQRKIMGAEYKPSKRTYVVVRILGAVFVVLGILGITGVLNFN